MRMNRGDPYATPLEVGGRTGTLTPTTSAPVAATGTVEAVMFVDRAGSRDDLRPAVMNRFVRNTG